jgi:hypothetical protein
MKTGLADRYDALIEELSQALLHLKLSAAQEAEVVTILADSFGLGEGMGIYWGTVHLIEWRLPSVAYPVLQDKAKYGGEGSRYWCCLLLGRRRNPDDLRLLLSLLRDESPDVRRQTLHALVMLAQETPLQHALPSIQPLLDDTDPGVRKVAQRAVASMGGRDHAPGAP